MLSTKQKKALIVEVAGSSLRICVPNRSAPEEFSFGNFALRDMEVPNPAGLTEQMHAFFSEKKITGFDVVVIFHDSLCFELDLTGLPASEQDIKYDRFIETVPMEAVMARKITIGDKIMVGVAVNRNTYEFFKSSLSLAGLNIIAAVPAVAAKFLGYDQQLSEKSCTLLNKHTKQLLEFSFFNDSMGSGAFAPSQRKMIGQHQVLFGLVSLVSVAIALGTSVYTLRRSTPKPKVIPLAAAEVSPTPVLEATPTVELLPTADLNVQIFNASGSNVAVQKLRSDFIATGFTRIGITVAATRSATTRLGFGPNVSPADQAYVSERLNQTFSAVESVSVPDINMDIYMVVGTNSKSTP